MLQQFLRTASDGWELALTSVRNLFAEADLYADEVGGDFAAEAQRLGEAVGDVHQLLADHFPTSERTEADHDGVAHPQTCNRYSKEDLSKPPSRSKKNWRHESACE